MAWTCGLLQRSAKRVKQPADISDGIVAVDGNADAASVMHDVDVCRFERCMNAGCFGVLKSEDTGGLFRIKLGHGLQPKCKKPCVGLLNKRVGVRSDGVNANTSEIAQRSVERIDRREARHAD
jgi:hypothetical protein